MSYIKDYKDRLFLGRIAIHPERLSEASENAVSLGVEEDGTLVQGVSGGDPEPLDPAEVTASTLDGLVAGTDDTIVETDSILEALAKLQAQIDAINNA